MAVVTPNAFVIEKAAGRLFKGAAVTVNRDKAAGLWFCVIKHNDNELAFRAVSAGDMVKQLTEAAKAVKSRK